MEEEILQDDISNETQNVETIEEDNFVEPPIKVYIRVNKDNNIIEINSEEFIADTSEWIKIDEGFGDKYRLAQGHYLDEPLMNDNGEYNYIYVENKIKKKGVK